MTLKNVVIKATKQTLKAENNKNVKKQFDKKYRNKSEEKKQATNN